MGIFCNLGGQLETPGLVRFSLFVSNASIVSLVGPLTFQSSVKRSGDTGKEDRKGCKVGSNIVRYFLFAVGFFRGEMISSEIFFV